MKKIIFKPGALGDTILTFDLLKNLQEYNYEITFVGNREYISLIPYFRLGNSMAFDHLIFLPLFCNFPKSDSRKIQFLKDFLNTFEKIIWISLKKGEIFNNLKYLVEEKKLIYIQSYPNYPISIRIFLAKEILKQLNLNIKYKNFVLYFQINNNNILIHPGAGSKIKRWELDNFKELIKLFIKKNYYITLIEGPAEPSIIENFYNFFKEKIQYKKINTPFEFIEEIKKNSFYIGNDSGLTHLASFLGIRGIAIFGTTDPRIWNPNPNIPCIYEVKKNGITFPSLDFVVSYLQSIKIL